MKSKFDKIYEDYTNQFKVPPYEDPGVIENPELAVGDPCYIEYHSGAGNRVGKYKIAKINANMITCDPMFDMIGDRPDTTEAKEGEVLDAVNNIEPQKETLEFNKKDIVFQEPHEGDNLRHYIIVLQREPMEDFFINKRVPDQADKDKNKAKEEKDKETEPVVKKLEKKPDLGIKTDAKIGNVYLNAMKK